jgi:uncharacterized circularly permuted ATP-grasp superfamily protein
MLTAKGKKMVMMMRAQLYLDEEVLDAQVVPTSIVLRLRMYRMQAVVVSLISRHASFLSYSASDQIG